MPHAGMAIEVNSPFTPRGNGAINAREEQGQLTRTGPEGTPGENDRHINTAGLE